MAKRSGWSSLDQDQDFIGRRPCARSATRSAPPASPESRSAATGSAPTTDGSMPDFFAVIQDNGERIGEGHLGVLLASPGQEHRIRHGSRRARRTRNRAWPSSAPMGLWRLWWRTGPHQAGEGGAAPARPRLKRKEAEVDDASCRAAVTPTTTR